MEGADQADDGGFAGAGGADERGDGSLLGLKADAMQNGLFGRVGKLDILEAHVALDRRHLNGAAGGLVLFEFRHDFVGAVEAGKGLGELRADVHKLEDRRNHQGEEDVVLEVVADGPLAVEHEVAAHPHDQRRDQPEHGGGSRGQARWSW